MELKLYVSEGGVHGAALELELELIQSHITQKPVLRGEMGAERPTARLLSAKHVLKRQMHPPFFVKHAHTGRLTRKLPTSRAVLFYA